MAIRVTNRSNTKETKKIQNSRSLREDLLVCESPPKPHRKWSSQTKQEPDDTAILVSARPFPLRSGTHTKSVLQLPVYSAAEKNKFRV